MDKKLQEKRGWLSYRVSFFSLVVMCVLFLTYETSHAKNTSDLILQNQQIEIVGNVVDDQGLPLPYVNVVEQGTSNGVITDNQGNYSIRVSATDAVLVFSSIGFNTQTISVDDERVINISMEASISGLDEVVVIGYGTSSKRDITGAVSAISEDEFNGGAITNPLQQ